MRVLRWLLVLGILLISYQLASHAEWHFILEGNDGVRVLQEEFAPLWAPPQQPPYEQLARELHEIQPESHPGKQIKRSLSEWAPFEWMTCVGALTLILGLVYLAVRRGRRDVFMETVLSSGIWLLLFSVAEGLVMGQIPWWFGIIGAILVAHAAFKRSTLASS